MQILDARERIQVVIEGEPPPGIGAGLRIEGFRKRSANLWDAPANPINIMAAQAIGREFFGEES